MRYRCICVILLRKRVGSGKPPDPGTPQNFRQRFLIMTLNQTRKFVRGLVITRFDTLIKNFTGPRTNFREKAALLKGLVDENFAG